MKKTLLYDLRAEVWLAWQQQQQPEAEVLVRTVGTFRRAYEPDIAEIQPLESDTIPGEALLLAVNREGFYDMLPEALHHPNLRPDTRHGEAAGWVARSRQIRQEEKLARQFWQPFEQESFRQRRLVEQQENLALTQRTGPLWDEVYDWLLNASRRELTGRQKACLLDVWINAHRTVGSWPETADYFSRFLEARVTLTYGPARPVSVESSGPGVVSSPSLGSIEMGSEWVLPPDRLPPDDGGLVRLSIGPVSEAQLLYFLPGGAGMQHIRLLADYLLPADADWQVEILPDDGWNNFQLSEEGFTGRLGTTSALTA